MGTSSSRRISKIFRYIFIQRRKRPLIENEYMIRIINRKSFLLLKNCPHCVLAIVSYFDSVANRQKYVYQCNLSEILTADSGRPFNANSCRVSFNSCTMTFLGRFSTFLRRGFNVYF